MRGAFTAFRWFFHVGHSTPANPLKLVALLLTFPCFAAGKFCFKRVYALQERLLVLMGRDQRLQKIDHGMRSDRRVVDVLEPARQIERGLQGAEPGQSFTNHSALPKVTSQHNFPL